MKTTQILVISFSLIMVAVGTADNNRQTYLEQNLMAPCCGGGVIYDHADNQKTALMKEIIAALINPQFEKSTIQNLFAQTYSGPGMYRFSYAPAKKNLTEIKNYIDKVVSAGMSNREILDIFGWIHGERILANPRAVGFNLTAWIIPALVFLLALFILMIYFRRQPQTATIVTEPVKHKIRHNDLIEKELQEIN